MTQGSEVLQHEEGLRHNGGVVAYREVLYHIIAQGSFVAQASFVAQGKILCCCSTRKYYTWYEVCIGICRTRECCTLWYHKEVLRLK